MDKNSNSKKTINEDQDGGYGWMKSMPGVMRHTPMPISKTPPLSFFNNGFI